MAHVVIFPYMAQGHTLPLLDISKALSSRGLKITIITTPHNASFILSKVSTHPSISLSILPFPRVDTLPEGCENTASVPSLDLMPAFVEATKSLKAPFEATLRDMSHAGCLPICVISDFFLGWTLHSCSLFNIPRIASHGMGVLPLAILRASSVHAHRIRGSDPITLPGLTLPFSLHKSDFVESVLRDKDDPFSRIISECEEADGNSWGFIVNSYEEMEGEYVPALESNLREEGKAWCVGPALLYDEPKQVNGAYMEWLDSMAMGSRGVMYVAFGTQAFVSEQQMEEIAYGLEMAGEAFIWAVKWERWVGRERDAWEERVRGRGVVVREWVEQRAILAHPAIGGFMSHCGWNSVLESLSSGVPILAWPMGAEQPLNAKVVTNMLGAGIMLKHAHDHDHDHHHTIGRHLICERVVTLMKGEEGVKARERARQLGKMAREAVGKGGSSDTKLDQFIHCLIQQHNTKLNL